MLFPRESADRQEDLAQGAVVRIWPRVRCGEVSESPPASYLRMTLNSCFVDEHRRPATRHETAIEPEAPESPALQADPESVAMGRQIQAAYQDCLEGLAEGRRDAVPLRLLGHSYREVADLLGCDVKAADNWISRGLVDLRRCLEEKGFAP